MQRVLFVICLFLNAILAHAQSATINTDGSNADASAMLDVKSTNKGFLMPRLTTDQRTAIVLPAKGLKVFDSDTNSFWFHNGTAWVEVSIGKNQWIQSGNNIYNSNTGAVGIGGVDPFYKLSVVHGGGTSGFKIKNTDGNGIVNIEGNGANADAILYFSRNALPRWILRNISDDNSFKIYEDVYPRLTIEAVTGNVGIGNTAPNAKLDVTGNARISGDITVNNGRGIVRSHNSTQLKVFRGQLGFTVTLGAGAWAETAFYDYENFGATPQIYVGNVLSYSSADWMKISVLPVEVSTTGCKFRIYNHSSTTATVTAVYQYMVMGAE